MQTRLYKLTAIAVVTSCSVLSSAYANDSDHEIMVITGTKTEKSILDTPIRTEVVTAEQLDKVHARDLVDGLKNVPGLTLVPIHGKSGQEVWIQGIDGDRVLVLIDGMPVTASTGSAVDLTQISVANIQQIEIAKGSLSALYGSEAMGGVVNVITAAPDDPFGLSLTVDGGGYGDNSVSNAYLNDQHYRLVTHKRGENWFVQLAADHRNKGGVDLDPSTYEFEGDQGTKSNVTMIAGYEFDNGGRLKFVPSWYQEDMARQYDDFIPGIGDIEKIKKEVATRKNLSVNYTGPLTDEVYLTTYYIHENFLDETEQYTVSSGTSVNQRVGDFTTDKAEVQIDFPVGDSHILTTGIVGYQSSLTQTKDGVSELDPNNPTRQNIEYYLQDDYFLTDEVEILPGIRAQYDSDFGSHVSPKLNLMYRPYALDEYQFRLRGGVGAGYRVPTLKERYYLFDHSNVGSGYKVIGNPDLTPESSISYQLGVDAQLSRHLWADLNLFHNDINDLITEDLNEEKTDEEGVQIYEYVNQESVVTKGFDTSLKVTHLGAWSGDVGYSYLEATDNQTGNQLVRRPTHQAKFSVNYSLVALKTELSLFGRFESESYADTANTLVSPQQSVFDFKVNTQLTREFKVFAGIDNITDTVQDTPTTGNDYRPSEGRFIYAGFNYTY